MIKSVYSKPKICKAKEGWYVYFRYNGKKKVYKYDLNRIDDQKEKLHQFNLLQKLLEDKLRNGWNPFSDIPSTQKEIYLKDALDFSLAKKAKSISKKTYSGYNGTVNFAKKAVDDLKLQDILVSQTKRAHIRTIIEKIKINRNLSNKAYNKHLNHLKALLSELVEWDILEYNPAHKIKNLKVAETMANIPANYKQHQKIKICLEREHPNFYNFIQTIFHSGIRPKEILGMQIYMIDLLNQTITLPANNTKTNSLRVVPINNHLHRLLIDMDLDMYPKEFYLFGSYRESGRGNIGKFIDFVPGPTRLKRDTATKRWKKIIKDGLGINVNMYSYKHKGGDEKIKAGISLDALRNQYGHTNPRMTEVYAKEIKNVYKNEIIDKSPEF